jgi:hypothetical protein
MSGQTESPGRLLKREWPLCATGLAPHNDTMSEWILLLYPVGLFTGLMLAARWQPKD